MLDVTRHFATRVTRFEQECARLERGGRARDGVVFLGDSLVEYYKGPLAWVNRGVCSDYLHWPGVSVFERLGPNRLHPDPLAIVTLIGINDVNAAPEALEGHVERYRMLLSQLAQSYPHARLAACSLLPTSGAYGHLNPAIEAFNRRLSELTVSTGAAFIDLHKRFVDSTTGIAKAGWLKADGLHLSRRGYAQLSAVLDASAAHLGLARLPRRTLLTKFIRAWRYI